jgi:hypothetical protein
VFKDSAYCVVRRGMVRIAWTQLPIHDGQATLPDSPVPVCLDFGEACRVRRCPTFQVPRTVMASWVARSGLGAGRLLVRRDHCRICGRLEELQEIDAGALYCPHCGGIGVLE